jgi:cellulose synthase/poly-beta-1,6-N-acetylglucosamine synthase-like glycosyltransferase
MPPIWAIFIVAIYFLMLLFVFSFSLAQLNLVYIYLFKRKNNILSPINISDLQTIIPFVTIQLPIYNELYVVIRLLEAITKMKYPIDKLEIQVLDDSTDETSELIKYKVLELTKLGFNITQIQRENRKGFKAGALAEGLSIAKGEFIAIFDADFIPNPDFLIETLPYFQSPEIGMVQTPWLHINEDYSFLTKLQAFGLDAHFTIDQIGRNHGGYFSNFNGTGGIWRKTCIEAAGGWSADSLTEDLDLSYRAQLAGWSFKYLINIGNPAELPAEINAIKAQQFRWAKGAAECARKLIYSILTNKKLSFGIKIHSFYHLMNSAAYIGLIFTALLNLPILIVSKRYPLLNNFIQFAQYFQISFVFLGIYFGVAYFQKNKNFLSFFYLYPAFLAFMMGLSFYNSIGVLEGYFGKKSPFIRTPKLNINSKFDSWQSNTYVVRTINFTTIIEGLLLLYFSLALIYVINIGAWANIPFLSMLVFGFGSVFGFSILHPFYSKGK